jgi:predicted DNA-binding protein YlxM (UPF0122 family)
MNEVWKSLSGIVEYGENYEVSNNGNVKHINSKNPLKGRPNPKGYLEVALYNNGKRRDYRVHRLVALAFIPNPEDKPQVNHKNGKKQCNYDWNLEWATNQENQLHAYANDLHSAKLGEDNIKAKLTESQVIEIKQLLVEGTSQYKIAELYGVTRTTVADIQHGKSWAHLNVEGFIPFSKNTSGQNNNNAKLTKEKVLEIRSLYKTGSYSHRELGKQFGVSKTVIGDILKYKTWAHID